MKRMMGWLGGFVGGLVLGGLVMSWTPSFADHFPPPRYTQPDYGDPGSIPPSTYRGPVVILPMPGDNFHRNPC